MDLGKRASATAALAAALAPDGDQRADSTRKATPENPHDLHGICDGMEQGSGACVGSKTLRAPVTCP